MTNEKLESLITKLENKTNLKEAIWQKSSGAEEFKLILKTGALTIQKYRLSNYQPSVVSISIYNLDGTLIEDYEILETDMGFDHAVQLFTTIKRNYYNVEEAVDDILSQLDSDDILGEQEDELPF